MPDGAGARGAEEPGEPEGPDEPRRGFSLNLGKLSNYLNPIQKVSEWGGQAKAKAALGVTLPSSARSDPRPLPPSRRARNVSGGSRTSPSRRSREPRSTSRTLTERWVPAERAPARVPLSLSLSLRCRRPDLRRTRLVTLSSAGAQQALPGVQPGDQGPRAGPAKYGEVHGKVHAGETGVRSTF